MGKQRRLDAQKNRQRLSGKRVVDHWETVTTAQIGDRVVKFVQKHKLRARADGAPVNLFKSSDQCGAVREIEARDLET